MTSPKMRWLFLLVVFIAGIVASLLALAGPLAEYRRPPEIVSTFPLPQGVGVAPGSPLSVAFSKGMDPETITPSTFTLMDENHRMVSSQIIYRTSSRTATLTPASPLRPGTTYRVSVAGGKGGIADRYDHPLATAREWRFTTGIPALSSPATGPGGPILLVTGSGNGFSQYYAEILRNEGFNEFAVAEIAQAGPAMLAKYDLVLLGEIALEEEQSTMFANWVHAGGNLIAMRPDPRLARKLGVASAAHVANDPPARGEYLSINPGYPAGRGLIPKPIQIHGPAERYVFSNGTALATLYADAKTSTQYPAISLLKLGHGNVVLYSYDLARSVVYTRQGNPAWSGQERDGNTPIRSDDLFYGASPSDPQPDWVDEDKIAIPQADIHQRLLANIITLVNLPQKPLPHFWYLPRGLKATVVMTGDDHGSGGTVGRFETFLKKSRPGCLIENWECIRATSNIFVGSIPRLQAASLTHQGFEIALHVYTGCVDWPATTERQPDGSLQPQVVRANADSLYKRQLIAFAEEYPEIPAPVSNRTDCITWGDFDTQPQVERSHGIRFDTNYYYWPAKWVRNRPGLFTGSGMPMRFARRDGSIVDVYQVATQMTDESNQVYPYTIDALLANALGDAEHYSVLTANMHHDQPESPGAEAIIASAIAHNVPVVTASQMLQWLDGRNASSFQNLSWAGGRLQFSIQAGAGANGIQALLPMRSNDGDLVSLTLDGAEVDHPSRTIAGLTYAAFSAGTGKFVATYRP